MLLNNDGDYKKLSDKTKKELNNIFKNCELNDVSDYIFIVLNNAFERDEIKEEHDMWRMAFKALNQYNLYTSTLIKIA